MEKTVNHETETVYKDGEMKLEHLKSTNQFGLWKSNFNLVDIFTESEMRFIHEALNDFFKDEIKQQEDWNDLKEGDILVAINECVMINGKRSLIKGKEYPINDVGRYIFIKSEVDSSHVFHNSDLSKYFTRKPRTIDMQSTIHNDEEHN